MYNKGFTNLIIIIFGSILVLLALGVLTGSGQTKKTVISNETVSTVPDPDPVSVKTVPQGTSNCGLYISTIENNDTVSSPIVIKGNTDGCGWGAFEAVVGNAKLFDLETGNQVGNTAILNTTSDWMTDEPVYFEGTINFSDTDQAKDGYIVIEHQQVADDDPELTHVISVKYQ